MIQSRETETSTRNSKTTRLYELWRALETAISIALGVSPISLAAFAALSGA